VVAVPFAYMQHCALLGEWCAPRDFAAPATTVTVAVAAAGKRVRGATPPANDSTCSWPSAEDAATVGRANALLNDRPAADAVARGAPLMADAAAAGGVSLHHAIASERTVKGRCGGGDVDMAAFLIAAAAREVLHGAAPPKSVPAPKADTTAAVVHRDVAAVLGEVTAAAAGDAFVADCALADAAAARPGAPLDALAVARVMAEVVAQCKRSGAPLTVQRRRSHRDAHPWAVQGEDRLRCVAAASVMQTLPDAW
jgi:hypothetical protein